MSLSETDARIALNSLPGIGVNNFHNLIKGLESAVLVFSNDAARLREVDGIGPKTAEQIKSCSPQKVADSEKIRADKKNIRIMTLGDEDYPANLKTLFFSPPVLYIAGEITEEDGLALGIVGTRRATPYGRILTENLAATLAAKGLTIVSGLARGVDTFAHNAALNAGGRTIAVLGCGLDNCYPPENRRLFEKITENGAVVSQFPFGTEPEKRNFPVRNRIITGLALGLLVIEAGEKSGALISAYAALEEGRELFAVPGRADSPQSAGTNRLIQKGAKLVTCADDVIEEFIPGVRELLANDDARKGEKAPLSGEEEKLLSLLTESEKHVDYLIEKSGFASGVVLGLLLELEIKGAVMQLPGKLFAKSR
ncbi:MAG: DNA-processing protein DprA [Nitrospinota bacterium]